MAEKQVQSLGDQILNEIETAIVGKRPLLEMILAAAVAGGHVLMEDFPGLGKTMIARSMAEALGLAFKRIQFTPDLLPSDVTGGYIYDRSSSSFVLRKGPLFSNIILADEINRASPKTQSALLEAMQESQVTLDGETLELPQPFLVIATQNPIEYEGTFPLPEAQLDRFLIKVQVGYPTEGQELEILKRRRERQTDNFKLSQAITPEELGIIRQAVEEVYIAPEIEGYIVNLVRATRNHEQVSLGASPRGSLALLKLSRARAALDGRDHVLPDDIKALAAPALVHRIILKPDLWLQPEAGYQIIKEILDNTPVPVLDNAL